jgi:SAM-dependent methyltransferase
MFFTQSTSEWIGAHKTKNQASTYDDFYTKWKWFRWAFRVDVRYRCRRLVEVAEELDLDLENKCVLDAGFGSGHMLAQFPRSCDITGSEISHSAVESAKSDKKYSHWNSASFMLVPPEDVEGLPAGPFDVIVSSHVLEHVPDDHEHLCALRRRLKPGGVLFLFVPIEEKNYNPDHVRNYSLDTVEQLVRQTGFDVELGEGSNHVNGHIWKVLTIPSRRRWPVLKPIVDALRLATLSAIPYRLQRILDNILGFIGAGPRQAMIVARKGQGARGTCDSRHLLNGRVDGDFSQDFP